MEKFGAIAVSVAITVLSSSPAMAFDLDGTKWLFATAEYHVDMEGMSATQISWNTAFIEAMEEWSQKTLFNFSLVEENVDPCLDNGISSVDFSQDFCGSSFGANVLALTVRRFDPQILGPPYIREADIIVNQQVDYDIFDGALVQFGKTFAGLDFGRVALHELGHVIGLDHEEENDAIMAPSIGNLFALQDDDIAGVKALYTGISNCNVASLVFGQITEVLDGSDCKVSELTLGGSDDSALDIYQFDIDEFTELDFTATSSVLDAVLILATTDLEYIDVDSSSPNDCNSSLSASLNAGSYYLMVNTFDEPVKDDCGIVGNYILRADFSSSSPPPLGNNVSLGQTFNTASYSGGITADNGASFGNVFGANQSLDISAEISVDARHRGFPGFLVVAVLIEDQILMMNPEGQFVEYVGGSPIVPFATKTLGDVEPISIANDLVPADVGIAEIEANIVVGYGLLSAPGDIYYHQTPLNLTVKPAS